MAAQRPRLATTSVLDITGVPVLVVQCIASSDDVTSFLQAMPAGVLTPELVALRELMTAPDAQPHYYWPTMHLTMTTDFEVDRIVTAMSIVPRASFCKFNVSQRWPASEHPDIRLPFSAFVATWALKYRDVTISATDLEEHRVAICDMLRHCTRLESVDLTLNEDVLAAMTTPAHSVSSITIELPNDAVAAYERCPAALLSWLASGCANTLTLDEFGAATDAVLAHAVASAPTLSKLALMDSEGLLNSLVANGAMLTHMTDLAIRSTTSDVVVAALVPLLALSRMQKLRIDCWHSHRIDLGCLAQMLPRTPHLVELRLQGVLFGDSVLAEGPTASNDNLPLLTIRHVLFRSVRFTNAGFDAILSWLDRVTTLDHIDWRFSTFLSDNVDCAVRAIQCCVKAGARFISLNGCGFQLQSTVALAKGFRYIRSRHSIEFDLGSNRMYLGGTRALLKALGACTNVSMRLHSDTIPFIKDSDAQLTKARASGVTVEWTGKILWLRSPVGDLDATPAK